MRLAGRLLVLTVAVALTAAGAGAAAAGAADQAPATSMADGSVTGKSTLHRSDDGIKATIRTSGLVKGNAYTVWVFGEGGPALGDGKVAPGNGTTTFHIAVSADEPAIVDPWTDGIRFVIVDHGPAIPELIEAQTTTPNGGCPPNPCVSVVTATHST